jgi:hypothetical protein
MKQLMTAAIALAIGTTALVATPVLADPPGDHGGQQHGGPGGGHGGPAGGHGGAPNGGWHKGDRFDRSQWRGYAPVDYRSSHLRRPPRGYEWRRVDNNFVLAAVATGVIADIVLAH